MTHRVGFKIFREALCLLIFLVYPRPASPGAPEFMEKEPNNAGSEAGALTPGTAIRGFFQTPDDQDWYKIRIEEPPKGLYEIRLLGVPGVDAAFEIYDSEMSQLKRINSTGRGETEQIPNMGLKADEYFFVVRGDGQNIETAYTLSFRFVEPWTAEMEFEPNDNMSYANPLIIGKPMTAALMPLRDQDWFSFRNPPSAYLLGDLAGVPGIDLYLDLYSTEGKRLMRIDYGKEGQGELLSLPGEAPGEYLLKVGTFDRTDVPRYRLMLTQASRGNMDRAALKAALRGALDFLAKTQKADGAWEGRHGDKSGLVGLALLAFIEAGDGMDKSYQTSIDRCLLQLKAKYRRSDDFPEGSRERAHYGGLLDTVDIIYSQAIGLTALIRTMKKNGDESLRPMIEDGLDVLIRSQNVAQKPALLDGPVEKESSHYGGWRFGPGNLDSDISVTAWVVFALHEGLDAGFPIPPRTFPDAAFFVKNCFIDDAHGFAWLAGTRKAGCARTASGVLALQLMGRADDPRVEAGCRFILKHPPVWNMEQVGGGFPFYYWHHATRALAFRGGADWEFWRKHVSDLLIRHQEKDGRWAAAQKEGYYSPAYVTALGALILELTLSEAAP